MPDTFDRLLRDNYYQGMRRFSPPLAPPFAPPPPINASITPEPTTTTQQTPDIQPAPEEPTQEPKDFISGAYLRRAIEESQPDTAKVEEQKSIAKDRLQAKLGRLYKPKEADPSFWQKFAVKPFVSALTWVEKIDATSYGIVRGTLMSAINGKTLYNELGIKPGDSLWKGAEEYTRRLGTAERLIGEMLLSPFNLLPVVGFGGLIAGKIGIPTAAEAIARVTSRMAREQLLAEGIMYKISPIRVMQGGLRARETMIVGDAVNQLLTMKNTLGLPARNADDVVMRLRAFAEGDTEALKVIFANPEKLFKKDYLGKEIQAVFKAANRMEGFDTIVGDPRRYLGIAKGTKDAATGQITNNPLLQKIMDDPYGFMRNPGKYIDDPAKAAGLKEMIDKASIDWDDFRVVVGGVERSPVEVASDIFGLVMQRAVPVTARSAKGQWNSTHPLATLGNVMFRFNRGLLRHGLTHFYLLGRPAYTAYNQVMNFNMMILQNPLLTFRYYLQPGNKVARYAKELFGLTGDLPAYIEQGFGYGYMMGKEVLEEGTRLAGKAVPLLGEGTLAKGIKDIAKEYNAVPPTQQPWIERAPFVGSLIRKGAAGVRGVNVGGEQFFRSGTYAMEHYKTFNKMQREMAKELGIKQESLLSLSQFPDGLQKFIEGKSIDVEFIAARNILSPFEMAMVDKAISELPKGYTILDFISAIKKVKKAAAKHYDELTIWYALHGGAKEASGALNDIALSDIGNVLRMGGFSEDDIVKNLDEITKLLTPQEQKFWEHIRGRPVGVNQREYVKKYTNAETNRFFEQGLKLDNAFVDKLRVVAAEHHSEALRVVNQASKEGTAAYQKDVSAIYQRMARKKMKLYDMWSDESEKLWQRAIDESKAAGTGVPLEAVDSPILMEPDAINSILKQHGMEDMLNLDENTASQLLTKTRKEGLKSLDNFEIQTMKNWEEMSKLGKTPSLDVSRIKFSLTSQGIVGDMPTAIRGRISTWLEKLPIRVKTNLKEISIDPSKFKGPKELKPNAVFDPNTQAIILRDLTVVRDEGTFFHELSHAYSNYMWETQGTGLQRELAKVLDPTIIGKLEEAGDYYDFYKSGGKLFEENVAETMSAWFSGGSEGVEKWVIGRYGTKEYADKLSDIYAKYFPKREIPGSEWMSQADLVKVRNTSMAYAKREGNRVAQYALFNYASRTNADWLMSTMMPYPYWQTRFILHWATRAIDNPSQFNAIVVLMKAWSESTKDLPTFLMASPIKLDLPDGSQVRFSPSQYFFPLSYTGLEVLRYGDQINDTIDAMAAVQDFVGGYLYPTTELAIGMMSYAFDIPGYKTRGIGVAKNPSEILRDLVPQLKLLRGTLGYSTSAVKFALEHGMFTDSDISIAIRAIGDDLNSGQLTDTRQAQLAIESLSNRRPHPLAIKYLSKVLKRKLYTDTARYSGAAVSKWYPEQQKTNYIQKLLYPKEGEPPAPDVQKAILSAYPGLEVIRGATVPAGLDRNQERQWEAAKTYYTTVDDARKGYLENAMKSLVDGFENPKEGATITPPEFIARRKELYNKYRGAIEIARRQADKNNAPIESDDRELFWRDVGRQVWPKHPLGELLNQYYDIEAANFPGTTALETDWQGFFKAKEDFLLRLVPWERKWLEDYLNDPSRADAGFRQAQETVRPYWSIRESMIANDPELETLLKQIEYYSRVDPDIAKIYERHPKVIAFKRLLKRTRISLREENQALNTALQKYWGYKPLS